MSKKTHIKSSKNAEDEQLDAIMNSIDNISVSNTNQTSFSSSDTPTENKTTTKKSDSTHNTTSRYATLMETNDKEAESWYYFIKYDGNEENLKFLHKQLDSIDWHLMDDLSVFDLDINYLVSAQTAKEMTKVELNAHQWHRKFDGVLQKVDFEFKKKDSNETKMCKIFDSIGYGQIEEFVDDEDIDDEDMNDSDDEDNDDVSSSDSESSEDDRGRGGKKRVKKDVSQERGHSSKVDGKSSDEETKGCDSTEKKQGGKGIPAGLLNNNLPRFAKDKRRYKK